MSRYVRIWNGGIHEYEYDSNRFTPFSDPENILIRNRHELTWPKPSGDPYYTENDFFLSRSMRQSLAAHQYVEFHDLLDSDLTVGSFMMSLLELDTVIVSYKIISISGSGDSARIVLRPFMKLDQSMMQIHQKSGGNNGDRVVSGTELIAWFSESMSARSALVWLPIGRFVMNLATIPFGGAGRAIAGRFMMSTVRRVGGRGFRYLVRVGGRRLLRTTLSVIVRKLAAVTVKISLGVVTGTIRRYYTQLRSNQLNGRVNPRFVESMNLDTIIREAVRDSIAQNVTGEITSGITSILPGGIGDEMIPRSMKTRITNHLTGKLMATVLGPLTTAIKAGIMAIDVQGGSQQSYQQRLRARLQSDISGALTAERFRSAMASGINEMVSSPDLIVDN